MNGTASPLETITGQVLCGASFTVDGYLGVLDGDTCSVTFANTPTAERDRLSDCIWWLIAALGMIGKPPHWIPPA